MNSSIINELQGPILVFGASGFIGANLYEKLSAERSDVFAIVRREKSWRLQNASDTKVIAADLNDYSAVKHLIDTVQPKTVFDLTSYGAYSFEKDINRIYQTNFQALVNLVSELNSKKIAAYIHAGSSSEYGTNSSAPDESSTCIPNSHYSISKQAASNFLEYMGKTEGFPCAHLRIYSAYGPLEDTSRLIPNILKNALNDKLPPFVQKEVSRDFIYIDDVCDAFILTAQKMNRELHGEIFNLGTGVKTTIEELAQLVKKEFSIASDPEFGSMENRTWDLVDWYSNPRKIFNLIGWKAKTSLKVGLHLTSNWIQTLTDDSFLKSSKLNFEQKSNGISAIVACYKDAQAIPHMHQRLSEVFSRLKINYEIIFVNDCSPDNSEEIIQEISSRDSNVIGISHSRNFGSQMAFRSGMEIATMQGIVLLDGDLQDPPELIEKFFSKWQEGYDVIYGRRVKRDMPFLQELLYKSFYRIFALFSYIVIPRDAGDFSLMDRKVVEWILQFPERDLFVRGVRAYVGFKQIGVDYIRPERMFGRSTNNLLKNIEWAKKGIFSFSNTPLTLLTSLGGGLLILSILSALILTALKIFFPDIAPKGATTILISILIFGSLNIFAIGILGEYISKILIEVKGRPRLIRSSITRNGVVNYLLPDGKKA